MAGSGMILIREVADAPVIMGISKPAGLKSPCGEVKIMNPLFVGIDVSSKNNVAYLMKPDGSKHSSFSVQNNLGGAKLLLHFSSKSYSITYLTSYHWTF